MSEPFLEQLKNFSYPIVRGELCFKLNNEIKHNFMDKRGVEIGGPSNFFKRNYPLYQIISELNIVNFSADTLWQKNKKVYYFRNKSAEIIVQDAVDLNQINSQKYDFLISSNCLEHIANPIRALKEWIRVVKKDSPVVLVLPKKDNNFDHRRSVSDFDHIVEDFNNNTSEDDLSHLEEILSKHDFSRDKGVENLEYFIERSRDNLNNRALHHHVYDLKLLNQIIEFLGKKVIYEDENEIDYLIIFKS